MSDTVPPIPPPFGANTSNPNSPIRAGNPTYTINNTTTTSVVHNVVDKNLPQLLDSKGGSHVINVFEFELYLLKILENGTFVPLSPLSTSTNPLPKPQNQWSHVDRRLANQDKRLKNILISCLPNDVMKSVIKCTSAKAIWIDLILANEGPSKTKDTKIAALRLKFNAFKALKEDDSDIEEDQRSSSESLADLNTEFHERALLANQKRLYKRYGRVGSSKKPMGRLNETCFACGKLGNIGAINKGKSEKGLVAESFDWDEELVSFDDEGVATFKALMAIADEELSVGKADAWALGGKGMRKDKISSKEVVFTKSDVSSSKTSHELPSDSESEVKRHGKTTYDVFRGRSLDISYIYAFGCPVHIHNHIDHLEKFDEKADDGFFLGYSLVAKAFRVFNIRRQEMEETYHVTFNEDDEAIS
uniref:Copia protein n=1 Tax=Tanacetum cinerariifolium TaxID=118510 RepID=A0A6L2MX25_TANCI|nr:copia protein [Tanacetum cinerariifolium]